MARIRPSRSRPGCRWQPSLVVALRGKPLSANSRASAPPTPPNSEVCAPGATGHLRWARENTAAECSRARALADPPDGSPVAVVVLQDQRLGTCSKKPDRAENSFPRRGMPSTKAGGRLFSRLSGAAVIPNRRAKLLRARTKRPWVSGWRLGVSGQSQSKLMRPPGGRQPFGLLSNGLKQFEAELGIGPANSLPVGSHLRR